MTVRLPPPVLALTPGTLTAGAVTARAELERAVGRAVEGGLRGLLVREPELPDREWYGLAQRLRELLCDQADVWVGLHDRPHFVGALEADGVHLGWRSLPSEQVRGLVGPEVAIGLSTHVGDPPVDPAVVSYAFHGPVFDTPSKRGLVEPIGIEGLQQAVQASPVPLYAIGGLLPESVGAARTVGAAGVAVRAGILGAADPGDAFRRFEDAWNEAG